MQKTIRRNVMINLSYLNSFTPIEVMTVDKMLGLRILSVRDNAASFSVVAQADISTPIRCGDSVLVIWTKQGIVVLARLWQGEHAMRWGNQRGAILLDEQGNLELTAQGFHCHIAQDLTFKSEQGVIAFHVQE